MADNQPHILHVHGSFTLGGKEARAIRLMNIWGDKARHAIVSADREALGARAAIDPTVRVDFPASPPFAGRPGVGRFHDIANFLKKYDLILTYNWGAMDAAMAHRMFSSVSAMPPLIHHEDGFNADEAAGLKPQRNLYRRAALGRAHALIVPSVRLESIARQVWKQPVAKVHLIRNGIDTARYAEPPSPDVIPGLRRSPGKLLVGTLAGLHALDKKTPGSSRPIGEAKATYQVSVCEDQGVIVALSGTHVRIFAFYPAVEPGRMAIFFYQTKKLLSQHHKSL